MFHHNFYMLQESSKGFRTCFSIVKGDKKEIYIYNFCQGCGVGRALLLNDITMTMM